jgi:hypothetical protein
MERGSTHGTQLGVDERWMIEWVEFGFAEIDRYLRRQAQFDAYLRLRRALADN